jgi:hypothetical protein
LTQSDVAALRTLADLLFANNKTGVEFTTDLISNDTGDVSITVTNSYDHATDKLSTTSEVSIFLCEKFWLTPVGCYHRDYRHPKDDPSKPFICGHCERLVHTVELIEGRQPFSDSVSIAGKGENPS